MESDVTIGQGVSTAPLAHAVVLTKLSNVLCTGGSVPIDVAQEVVQGVGANINGGNDGVVGAQDVVKKLTSFSVNYWGNFSGAGAKPLEVSSIVVGGVEVVDESKHLFIDSELFSLFHNSYPLYLNILYN